MNMMNADIPMV
jgi:hypothetical protein